MELGWNLMSRKNMSRNFTLLTVCIIHRKSPTKIPTTITFPNFIFLSVSCSKNCFVRKLCFCYRRKNKSSKPQIWSLRKPGWGECGPVGEAKTGRGGGGGGGGGKGRGVSKFVTHPSHRSRKKSVSMIDDGRERVLMIFHYCKVVLC
jgi:hypothetical protein